MVLIECKRLPKEEYSKDYDFFLHSTLASSNVGNVTDELQQMQNMRVRLKWMTAAAKQLAKDSCSEELQHHLLGPAKDAEQYLSLERTEHRQVCTLAELQTIIDTFKGGVMIVFPAECSGHDACRRLTSIVEDENNSDVEKSKAHRILSIIDDGAQNEATLCGEAVMWWSGKPLSRDAELSKYVGKNEKTKITVKLTKVGSAPPPREPAVDAKAQAELMTHYYRKQEEMKKVIEDEDISYGNSEWANPRGLKSQLLGVEHISYKPKYS